MRIAVIFTVIAATFAQSFGDEPRPNGDESGRLVRVGIIGLDTSHVVAFTQIMNAPAAKDDFSGVRVVAAFPGGNPDFPLSINRVAGFTEKLMEMGVEIVGSIKELLPRVDAVMLESVDGSQHLA